MIAQHSNHAPGDRGTGSGSADKSDDVMIARRAVDTRCGA
jgi:hypothetical protein